MICSTQLSTSLYLTVLEHTGHQIKSYDLKGGMNFVDVELVSDIFVPTGLYLFSFAKFLLVSMSVCKVWFLSFPLLVSVRSSCPPTEQCISSPVIQQVLSEVTALCNIVTGLQDSIANLSHIQSQEPVIQVQNPVIQGQEQEVQIQEPVIQVQ